MDYDQTKMVLAELEKHGVHYIVIGGVALNLLGLPRATLDLDLFIAPEHHNIERLKKALDSVFADPCIEEISADDLIGDYPAVQYVPPAGSFSIDILTRLGEAFTFVKLGSQRVAFEELTVSVATSQTLYQMKKIPSAPVIGMTPVHSRSVSDWRMSDARV